MNKKVRAGFGLAGIPAATLPGDLKGQIPAPVSAPPGSDGAWMELALRTAMSGVGLAPPNPVVGCVLVGQDGQLLAAAHPEVYGQRHAETAALAALKDPAAARGCTAYVTLEPCCHQGRQPPCTDALIGAGIARCVVATRDPVAAVDGEGLRRLEEAGIRVDVGVLGEECLAFHLPFILHQGLDRPVFAGKWAQTLDGHLAGDDGRSQWISGPASRALTHFLRQKYDAIMVGAPTVLADQPRLDVRSCAPPINRHPVKVLFDPSGRLAAAPAPVQNALREGVFSSGEVILISPASPAAVGDGDARVLQLRASKPAAAAAQLGSKEVARFLGRPLQSVLVEGGPGLLSALLRADLLDCCHVFVSSAILGGNNHRIGSGQTPGEAVLQHMQRLSLVAANRSGDDVLMEMLPADRLNRLFG